MAAPTRLRRRRRGALVATRVETVDTLNALLARGYGFVATESTERTGDQRWDVADPSPATNPDLARLARLRQHLVDTTEVTASTPLLGLGMSNGARFVSLWGQEWADAGHPVRAVALYMGRIAAPVTAAGGLTVPAWFVTAENDVTVPRTGSWPTTAGSSPRGRPPASRSPASSRWPRPGSSASPASTHPRRMADFFDAHLSPP